MSVGWGRLSWGQAGWNDATTLKEGWGRLGWGSQVYGDAPNVDLVGVGATTSVGSITVELRPGWGTLDWGENGWGSVEEGIEVLTGQAMTSAVGTITPADVMGLTGQAMTSSVGEFTGTGAIILSPTITPTGQAATISDGQLSINAGADHVQGLASLVATTATGSLTVGIGVDLTGVDATSSVGDLTTSDAQVFTPTGVGATTSVGAIIPAIGVSLTGQAMTSGVGVISPADVMGLTGVSATITVGNVAPLGYQDIDIDGNTSYSAVNKTNSASYSDVDVSGNTSYTDVTHVA